MDRPHLYQLLLIEGAEDHREAALLLGELDLSVSGGLTTLCSGVGARMSKAVFIGAGNWGYTDALQADVAPK